MAWSVDTLLRCRSEALIFALCCRSWKLTSVRCSDEALLVVQYRSSTFTNTSVSSRSQKLQAYRQNITSHHTLLSSSRIFTSEPAQVPGRTFLRPHAALFQEIEILISWHADPFHLLYSTRRQDRTRQIRHVKHRDGKS